MKTSEIAAAVINKITEMETPKGRRVVSIIRGHVDGNAWFKNVDDNDARQRSQIIEEIESAIKMGVEMEYLTSDNAAEIRALYA